MTFDTKRVTALCMTCVLSLVLVAPAFAAEPAAQKIEDPATVSSLGVSALAADDQIPGVPAPSSPITGTITADTDEYDVFSMNLVAGQELGAVLNGAPGTDFDLWLFAPGTTTFASPTVATALAYTYPDAFTYLVPTTGTYYLAVHQYTSSGDYTVAISETIVPVVTCTPAPFYTGSASFAIGATDTGGSGVKSITYQLDGETPVTVNGSSATVTTNKVGLRTVLITASDGAGNVSLPVMPHFAVQDTTTLALAAPRPPAYGKPAVLSATLRGVSLGNLAGMTVMFERQSGTSWVNAGSAITNASGVATASVMPFGRAQTAFRTSFAGAPTCIAAVSANAFVTPKVSITRPNAPTSMAKGKAAVVSGYLKPRHAAGSYPVRIYKYRYVGGKWKAYGYTKAKASNYRTFSRYTKSMSLPAAGRWRLRAYCAADAKHAATWSTYDYVTVK